MQLTGPQVGSAPLRLELQAGAVLRNRGAADWIHTDIRPGACIEHVLDASKPLPWSDNFFVEVAAFDALEHHSWRDTERILKEWVRVLDHGGLITMTVPNAGYLCREYLAKRLNAREFSYWLFGGQDYEGDLWKYNAHFAAFDEQRLQELFDVAALSVVRIESDGGSNLIAVGRKK